MKTTNKTLKKMGAALWISTALLAASAPSFAGTHSDNPFADDESGDGQVTPEVQRQIDEYAGSSRLKLQMALKDTQGSEPKDALPALVDSVCEVVASSYHVSRGSELLFRIVLKQALKTVHGWSEESYCRGPKVRPYLSAALLGAGANQRMRQQLAVFHYQILRDSVSFAIDLAETDAQVKERVKDGLPVGMLELPYEALAFYRVLTGQIWNQSASFLGARMEYAHLQTIAYQWLTIITNKYVMNKLDYAAVLSRTQKILRETSLSGSGDPATAPYDEVVRNTRRLRYHLAEMITELRPKYFPQNDFKPTRVDDIIKSFDQRFLVAAPAAK